MERVLLKSIKDENLKVLPESAIKCAYRPESDPRNAAWDLFVTKSGRVFISICAELYVSAKASIYEYIYETNELKLCFNFADRVCQFSEAISPSKIHTSMCEMRDGRIIMTTHTTAQSPVHPYWHPEPYYNHTFEGYQGSNVLIYDPESGAVENLGVPVPHESIYGAKYVAKSNSLYFTGYFRGHLYCLNLDTMDVRDYGQVTEFGSFRLHTGTDNKIYMSSRSGNLIRINTDTGEIEDTGVWFEKDYEPYSTGVHTTLNYIVNAPDGCMYLAYIFSKNIYRFNPATLELTNMGSPVPEGIDLTNPHAAYAMVLDENGVLWYALNMYNNIDIACNYLCRWDIANGGKPKNFGLLGTVERVSASAAEGHYLDGIMYISDSNHGVAAPGIMAVNLRALDAMDYDIRTAELPFVKDIWPYTMLEKPTAEAYKYSAAEFESRMQVFKDFCGYLERYYAFLAQNPMQISCSGIQVHPLWKMFGPEKSRVHKVRFIGGRFVAEFGAESGSYLYDTVSRTAERIAEFSAVDRDGVLIDRDLPCLPGRQYKAIVSCMVGMGGDRYFFGTEDGMLGILNGKDVFGLGSCSSVSGGAVDVCYCEKTNTVYGILGGKHDIGIVFSYNDRTGLRFMGNLHYTLDNGLFCSFELSSIAVSDDGRYVAIGTKDRLGLLHILEI